MTTEQREEANKKQREYRARKKAKRIYQGGVKTQEQQQEFW